MDALASEYQNMYRDADGNLRFAYGIDHSDLFRPSCVFGPGFREKLDDLGFTECCEHATPHRNGGERG